MSAIDIGRPNELSNEPLNKQTGCDSGAIPGTKRLLSITVLTQLICIVFSMAFDGGSMLSSPCPLTMEDPTGNLVYLSNGGNSDNITSPTENISGLTTGSDAPTACQICPSESMPDNPSATVTVHGMNMTCQELFAAFSSDLYVTDEQCQSIISQSASECCFTPPANPCNICSEPGTNQGVNSNLEISFHGVSTTCGAVFNELYTTYEQNSDMCTASAEELSSCCFEQCSLCGNLHMDASAAVLVDGASTTCANLELNMFDLEIPLVEGSEQCQAFQAHRDACCYDTPCNLCSANQDGEQYTLKGASTVNYKGRITTCGDIATQLSHEMNQSHVCSAAIQDVSNECCFHQCHLCNNGESIHWGASTMIDGILQTCADVYFRLMTEELQEDTCFAVREAGRSCCFSGIANKENESYLLVESQFRATSAHL